MSVLDSEVELFPLFEVSGFKGLVISPPSSVLPLSVLGCSGSTIKPLSLSSLSFSSGLEVLPSLPLLSPGSEVLPSLPLLLSPGSVVTVLGSDVSNVPTPVSLEFSVIVNGILSGFKS